MAKFILGAALALVLTACGGGGGEAPGAAPSVPPTQTSCTPLSTVRIQLFGDSTMFGVDPLVSYFVASPNNPGHALQAEMDQRFGVGAVTVEDRGVSNSNSSQLIAGSDGVNPPWPQEVAADIIVVNHGINDAQVPTGIEQYKANLRAFAKAAPIVFETPNPGYGRPIEPDAYAQAMREVAAELGAPVADTFAYVQGLPNWQSYVPDGIHPDGVGYRLIAHGSVAPAVAPLVAKLKCQ